MDTVTRSYFDLEKINENYKLVIDDFERINTVIHCKRDIFDAAMARNLLYAYNHINNHLASNPGRAMLSWKDILELNLIVHLGTSAESRRQYYRFIKHTEERFEAGFPSLMQWYERHEHSEDDPYKIAAGLYVRILAKPQLFVEGNHRTGALVANYFLLLKSQEPFVMTPGNAVEFLNLASDVKFKSNDIRSKFKRAIGWRDELARMRAFLKESAGPFTTGVIPKWTFGDYELREAEDVLKSIRRRRSRHKGEDAAQGSASSKTVAS